MNNRTATRIGWGGLAFFLAVAGVGMAFVYVALTGRDFIENLFYVAIFGGLATVGALVVSRHPGNAIGWLFVAVAGMAALAFAAGDGYAQYAYRVKGGHLPLAIWAAWLSNWWWVVFIGPFLVFVPLLFPDGKLPSPRWRPFAWFAGILVAVTGTLFALSPDIEVTGVPRHLKSPLGVPALRGALDFFNGVGFLLYIALGVTSVVSLFLRLRRARAEERQQIKWFVYAFALLVGYFVISGILEALHVFTEGNLIDAALGIVAFMGIPVSAGIAILKYRLYDVDIVIKRTVVFGLLAAFITALYVGIVIGLGALVSGAGTNRALNIGAAVIIALAFQPARNRARHLANRLVYGKRATPYEVLSEFSERLGGRYALEDLLPTLARMLAEGTGAKQAGVWLKVGDELRASASWPPGDAPAPEPRALGNGALPAIPDADAVFPVEHQGELLGALTLSKPRGEAVTPDEQKLLSDLASQAALVLRNVRLNAELQAKLEELQASRQRIVAAQDAERRRLERNIHDGAQQQLVALSVKLRLARTLAGRDPARAEQMLTEVEQETIEALETLRDLARGIYPPLLADQGLAAALTAQARKVPIPVEVDPDGVGRYPQDVEAAVYFCCLEALQNISKYANATSAVIQLRGDDGYLRFEVKDDGLGFDAVSTPKGSGLQNMADRLAALEGSLEIRSRLGKGTTVAGSVPARALQPAMA
ncbi:MAG TPA: GAF domain-containing sensor histidine kinase [Actinomycetota bacterium]|jgi:signal transduction histidine kinase